MPLPQKTKMGTDSPASISAAKNQLRKTIHTSLATLSKKEICSASEKIGDTAIKTMEWNDASVVLAFLPMEREVQTNTLINSAVADGKFVAVPRMHDGEIKFYKIYGLSDPWDLHPYGVREPKTSAPRFNDYVSSGDTIFACTPGLAFDGRGNRLGHGKGYYDRFISKCRKSKAQYFFVGLCFSLQLVDRVPISENDQPLDYLICENQIIRPME